MADEETPKVLRERVIPLYTVRPGKRLVLVAAEIDDRPGTAANVLKVLAEAGVNVRHQQANVMRDAGYGTIRAVGEAPPSLVRDEFEAALRETPGVRFARVEESPRGFLVDAALPLRAHGGRERVLSLTTTYFAEMLDHMRSNLGSGGAVLVNEQGYALGKEAWTGYVEQVGADRLAADLGYAMQVLAAVGWGRPRIVSANLADGTAEVRLEESFECSGRKLGAPYSQFLRGYLGGAFEVLARRPVECAETQCVAKGDEACVFEVRAKADPSATGREG